MEALHFEYRGGRLHQTPSAEIVVGVVGSGNLEVMVEHQSLSGACHIEVITAATGFGTIWQAVLNDFFVRHPLGDVCISINDVGATPAVVSLRLDQAIETFRGNRS